MLRRDFLAAIASFTAAGAVAKAALAPAKTPQEKVGEFFRDRRDRGQDPSAGAVLVPQEFSDALDERSLFERTIVDCLRDNSMYCLGVTSDRDADYRVMYRPAKHAGEVSPEQSRAEAMLAMYDRGMVYVEQVNVYNEYDGFEVFFSICTKG